MRPTHVAASRPVTPEEPPAAVLEAIAALPSDTAETVRSLLARGERRAVELLQLQQVVTALLRSLDEDTILDELSRGTLRVMGGTGAIVALREPPSPTLETRRHVGPEGNRPLIPLGPDEGALAGSLLGGTPRLYTRDDASDAVAIDATLGAAMGVEALLVVPMVQGHTLHGVILAYAGERHAFDADSQEFLQTVAIVGSTALRNARLYAESEQERRQSDAMAEVARAAGESLRVAEVQRLIMRHAMALLRTDGASVLVRDGDFLLVEAAVGIAQVLAGVVVPVHGSLTGRVVTSGEPCISNEVGSEPDAYRRNLALVPVARTVIVPLRTARGTIGALSVYNRDDAFSASDARILQRLADQVAVAIVNSRLFTDLQEATREWSATFDALDVGVVVVNDEGRVLRGNLRARQLVGTPSPVGLLGRPFYAALLGDAGATLDPDPVKEAIEAGANGRAQLRGADGRLFDVAAVPHQDGGAVVTFDLAGR